MFDWKIKSAFDTWTTHMSLKLHMLDRGYNFFRYHGKLKVDYSAFEKRNDRYFYERFYLKNVAPGDMLLANVVINPRSWIGDINSDVGFDNYLEWCGRRDTLSFVIEKDLSKLSMDLNESIVVRKGQLPMTLRLFLGNRISIETVCLMVEVLGLLDYWKKELTCHIMAPEILLRIEKYLPFVEYDRKKMISLIEKRFETRVLPVLN